MSLNISVIIPLYNKEKAIKSTVLSVLNQKHKDFELLIVDDGSTDNSLGIVSQIDDPRIKILSKVNGGVSDARNFGVKNAKFDYIFLLDADDLITKDCLLRFSGLASKYADESVFTSNLKVTFAGKSDLIFCRGNSEKIVNEPLKALWERKVYPRTGSMLIKKECFEQIGYFNTNITSGEDLEFTLRMLNKYKVVYTPRVLFYYQADYAELSVNSIPLTEDLSFHSKPENKSFFERLILVNNIYLSLITRVRGKDWAGSNYLFKKIVKHFRYFVFSFFYRKTLNLFYKIRERQIIPYLGFLLVDII